MSSTLLVINLTVSIILIIGLILIPKLNPMVSLIIASAYMGISCGLGVIPTLSTIAEGFGSMMTNIGIPIGLGVILGQLMSDSGAAQKIAITLVHAVPSKYVMWALAGAGFLLAIPVFFDITFIILVPIGIAVAKEINKPMSYVATALIIGDVIAQTYIPPTPNPLAAPGLLGYSLGTQLIVGLIVGAIVLIPSMIITTKFLDKGLFNDEKDINHEVDVMKAMAEKKENRTDLPQPSFIVSMIPLMMPVVLILISTVLGACGYSSDSLIVSLFGNKIFTLSMGVLASYLIAWKHIGRKAAETSSNSALGNAGVALAITGAGGSFGKVIAATNIGTALTSALHIDSGSVISVLLFAYFLGFIFRVAQGSGTVAGITSMTIMATIAPSVPVHPVWIAMACLAGGISIGHVNDSGFWVCTNLSGFTVTGGLKTYTLPIFVVTVFTEIAAIVGALVLPMV
ncbi:SLC13 family permease [Oscillibacter sp.]|uniref:GntP family permease n=1 Tax=Oscillibacter sp. TaxID=1945593 RepID=UPI0028AB1582|nr:SLC13 family permease [Oscillibacter sp.]